MESLTKILDEKIRCSLQQSRGWQDVGHDQVMSNRWADVAMWFKEKKNQRLKAIFGS